MTDNFALPRKLVILAIVLPLAGIVGYLLASPTDVDSVAFVGLLLLVLATPLFLRWHHPMLIFSWNASIIIFFLPGSPYLWMVVGGASFGLMLLNRILDKDLRLLNVPSVSWSLIALGLVVFVTANMTGGAGLRSLGAGVYGGKKYFYIWFTIIAYFALSFQRIPSPKAGFYTGMFLLSGVTAILSNLIYLAGPSAWFFYSFFPVDWAISQAVDDFGGNPFATRFGRLGGLAAAGLAAYPYMIMRYGIRGIMDWTKPWRFAVLLLIVAVSLLGGFRSALVVYLLLFAVQFCMEGLFRSRLFPILAVTGVLAFVGMIPFVQKLPLSVQRSLSVLPLPVSPLARADAQASTEWRLRMWQLLTPEISQHFWAGKGYTASATDYYLAVESVRRGFSQDYEMMILSGDYHNGPLSIIIPFGIWGVLAFLAFVIAALRVLFLNHRHGDPSLQRINTFLFSYFVVKLIFFSLVFGSIHSDIIMLAGIVGLSISLNGGVVKARRRIENGSRESEELREAKPTLSRR